MPTIKIKPLIIGLLVLVGLSLQTNEANALYSPTISQKVSAIREHVYNSQAQNGSGSILEIIENVKAYDKAKRETFDETGISAEARIAQELLFEETEAFLLAHPLDSLFMVFNYEGVSKTFISNCLRNDIWSLEKLRDVVGQEMVKAYLNRDSLHGNLLQEDYVYLSKNIMLLRQYGGDPTAEINALDEEWYPVKITSNEYFFGSPPEGSGTAEDPYLNYYSIVAPFGENASRGCPNGEFTSALKEVKNSWEVLKVLGSGQNVEWGNIWQMAEANARIRAKQWIRANQISLTIGGKNGGNLNSLIAGGGWDKFAAKVETQGKIIERMVGMVTPLFDMARWTGSSLAQKTGLAKECTIFEADTGKFRDCTETEIEWYQYCKKDKENARLEGIRCDRFRNTQEQVSIVEKATAQQKLENENTETKKEAETAFRYQVTLDSVGEQALYEFDRILWDMNMVIKRGYEGVDRQAGEGIPSLLMELESFTRDQCPNKQQ
jgi:hypothetical protein